MFHILLRHRHRLRNLQRKMFNFHFGILCGAPIGGDTKMIRPTLTAAHSADTYFPGGFHLVRAIGYSLNQVTALWAAVFVIAPFLVAADQSSDARSVVERLKAAASNSAGISPAQDK